jgi:hypothetical protein
VGVLLIVLANDATRSFITRKYGTGIIYIVIALFFIIVAVRLYWQVMAG